MRASTVDFKKPFQVSGLFDTAEGGIWLFVAYEYGCLYDPNKPYEVLVHSYEYREYDAKATGENRAIQMCRMINPSIKQVEIDYPGISWDDFFELKKKKGS